MVVVVVVAVVVVVVVVVAAAVVINLPASYSLDLVVDDRPAEMLMMATPKATAAQGRVGGEDTKKSAADADDAARASNSASSSSSSSKSAAPAATGPPKKAETDQVDPTKLWCVHAREVVCAVCREGFALGWSAVHVAGCVVLGHPQGVGGCGPYA